MADNVAITAGTGTTVATDDVAGVQYQRVKLDGGADGAATPITAGQTTASASLPVVLATDGTLIPGTSASALGKAEDAAHTSGDVGVMALSVRQNTAAALSGADADYQPLITDTNGRLHVIASSNMSAPAALADATANPTVSLLGSTGMRFNGATWDRYYGNNEVSLLASAARTASTATSVQTNYNARGVMCTLYISASPGGAETLTLYLQSYNIGAAAQALLFSSGVVATGTDTFPKYVSFLWYPGVQTTGYFTSAAIFNGAVNLAIPRRWGARVIHSSTGSWTYQLDGSYIL